MTPFREQASRPDYAPIAAAPYDYEAAAKRSRRVNPLRVVAMVLWLLGVAALTLATDSWLSVSARIAISAAVLAVSWIIAYAYGRWLARAKSFYTDKLAAETASFLAAEEERSRRVRVETGALIFDRPIIAVEEPAASTAAGDLRGETEPEPDEDERLASR